MKGTYLNKSITISAKIEQKITKIVVEPTSIELNMKGSKSIKATAFYADGSKASLSSKMNWESSNPAVASISTTTVKGVSVGSATLSGSYQDIPVSVQVTVVPKLMKVAVEEKTLKLAPGEGSKVKVLATYDTGSVTDVAAQTIWTSSKPGVAAVSPTGQITALAEGKATVKGKFGSKNVTISVTVSTKK